MFILRVWTESNLWKKTVFAISKYTKKIFYTLSTNKHNQFYKKCSFLTYRYSTQRKLYIFLSYYNFIYVPTTHCYTTDFLTILTSTFHIKHFVYYLIKSLHSFKIIYYHVYTLKLTQNIRPFKGYLIIHVLSIYKLIYLTYF